MNIPKAIKVIRPGDIRKLHTFPSSFEELQESIREVFQLTRNGDVEYMQNTTPCKISSTSDLISAYNFSAGLPSLKLYVTKPTSSRSEICSLCKMALKSVVYYCLDCFSYICDVCEEKTPHPHLLIKAKSALEIKSSNLLAFNPDKFMHQVYRFEKKMMKLKVISHVISKDLVVKPGQEVVVGWKLQNSGSIDWPEGTALMWRCGDIRSPNIFIEPVKVGGLTDVSFTIKSPETIGAHTGAWEVVVRGSVLSKLKVKLFVGI